MKNTFRSIFQGNLIWIFLNSPTPIPNGEKMSQDRKLGGTTNETGFPLSLGQVVASVYQCLSSYPGCRYLEHKVVSQAYFPTLPSPDGKW